ncbi:glycosyltransferase family 4 protein [Flavobacterium sp.]|jgi:glycosyltransferase involved in cell wall biosynthesis|uniref:glycosyltransferase family 4 protein n=1 Tax=Flavobacterium sp. TaxID=239 RepID=UPI002A81D308|nr:glycosyltransferase family 4 protein [Flavobacterium sp.]
MKNVLIINQSAELYGADKVILELIENFPKDYNPIVVLHEEGPLKELLEKKNIQVIKSSVIKVKRGILKPSFLLNLPFEIFSSIRNIQKQLNGQKISVIHSNATSVFIGAFYAFFFRIPHLWHVHEIIEKPKRIALVYPKVISFFANRIVFNSMATEKHFTSIKPNISPKSILIYNGQERTSQKTSFEKIKLIRQSITKDEKIIIGLVGRISEIKGQDLMIKAFSVLLKKHKNIHLVFIGSTVLGKESFLKKINALINKESLQNHITFIDFKEDIWPYYDSIDISVVPSKEKESFGLVATESMLSAKPVVAANHGGLSEIVVHNHTGFLFEPNNIDDLAQKLDELIQSEEKRGIFGENGYLRVVEKFNTGKFIEGIKSEYDKLTK